MKLLSIMLISTFIFSKNAISQANNSNAEQTTYYEYDALGNTESLSNNNGNTTENYNYTAFGEPVITDANNNALASSAFANRFMFTGREFIQQLNLYDYRNRIYSASLGRFMQTDPMRFDADDYNLYRYVQNNPVNITDPFGLRTWNDGGTWKTESSGSDGSYSYQQWGTDGSYSGWYNDANGNSCSGGWGAGGENYYEYAYDALSGFWSDEYTRRKLEKLQKEMEDIDERERRYRNRNRGVSNSDPEIKNLNKQWNDRYKKYKELDGIWWGVRGQ